MNQMSELNERTVCLLLTRISDCQSNLKVLNSDLGSKMLLLDKAIGHKRRKRVRWRPERDQTSSYSNGDASTVDSRRLTQRAVCKVPIWSVASWSDASGRSRLQ